MPSGRNRDPDPRAAAAGRISRRRTPDQVQLQGAAADTARIAKPPLVAMKARFHLHLDFLIVDIWQCTHGLISIFAKVFRGRLRGRPGQ